jgi:hypothetical protein
LSIKKRKICSPVINNLSISTDNNRQSSAPLFNQRNNLINTFNYNNNNHHYNNSSNEHHYTNSIDFSIHVYYSIFQSPPYRLYSFFIIILGYLNTPQKKEKMITEKFYKDLLGAGELCKLDM